MSLIRPMIAAVQCWVFLVVFLSASASFAAEHEPLAPPWTGRLPAHEVHPCLFFGAADLPALKARIAREPYKSWFARAGDSSPAVGKACIWLLTGEEKQAAAARLQLLNDPIYREPVHQYIEPSSHSFFNEVIAYDFLASWPGLSAADHQKIRDKLAREAEFYYQAMTQSKGGQHYGNQRTLGASALGLCALALGDYHGSAHTPQQWLDQALWAIKCPDNFCFWRPDGMFIEGYGYTIYMGYLLSPFMSAYSRLTGESLFSDPTLSQWMRYQAYFSLPDGRNINFGTSNYGTGDDNGLFTLYANRTASKANAGLYAWAARRDYGTNLHWSLIFPSLGMFDDQIDPSPAKFPCSALFASSEQMVMKDGWTDNLTGVWITGKASGWMPFQYDTYSHADVTSFIFYSGRQFLAVDAGYTHWQGPDCSGPDSHNLVLIDGKGPEATTLAKITDAVITPDVDAATIQTEYAGQKVHRVFLFGQKRILFIADFLAGSGKHDFLFQLHSPITAGNAQIAITDSTVVWPGFDVHKDKITSTTLNTFFAGPVKVKQIPSHWRPQDDNPTDNIAIGAAWQDHDSTSLLSALYAKQPNQPMVRVETETHDDVQQLQARAETWIIKAQSSHLPRALADQDTHAIAQLLVTCHEYTDGKPGPLKWIYVWNGTHLAAPSLIPDPTDLPTSALHIWNGKSWRTAAASAPETP